MIITWIYHQFCLRVKDSKEKKRVIDLKYKKVYYDILKIYLDSNLEINHIFELIELGQRDPTLDSGTDHVGTR